MSAIIPELTFGDLLDRADIERSEVRLVRHQARGNKGLTPWDLWLADDGRIEEYQRIQARAVFDGSRNIAAFVATPDGRTLFIGLYDVGSRGICPAGHIDPLTTGDVAGLFRYELTRNSALGGYAGRLIVQWGEGYRSWVQRAARQDKPIVELWPGRVDPPFPGLLVFRSQIKQIDTIPSSWREVLANARGVYLLRDDNSGECYVGSATGSDGFMGRWLTYRRTGDGGNVLLRGKNTAQFTATILEVAGSTASVEEIVARESVWKDKLGSRAFGLNAN